MMNPRTPTRTSAALVAGTALAALVLAGCGNDTGTTGTAAGGTPSGSSTAAPATSASYGPAASGPHNAQDVGFVSDMLPHHSQAVEMADMALAHDTTPEVKALAQQIKDAQAPEIAAMSGWLAGWGVPAAGIKSGYSTGSHGTGGHSTGGMMGSTGMMDADRMGQLDMATGTGFARMWLINMTEHHTGAVEMARTETASGQNEDAKKLAAGIVSSQTAEIATMKHLLTDLG